MGGDLISKGRHRMAISNLALAKHLDGSSVSANDIKVGLLVNFPSGLGGVIEHKCVNVTAEKAEFYSTNKEWPTGFTMILNVADFTLEDFELLTEALVAYSKWDKHPTDEQRAIVRKAHELGYAYSISHTQANWTDKGIDAYGAVSAQMNIINAAPLLLKPLSQQIKEAGGEGFNDSVKVEKIENSFSCVYTFKTEMGEKSIRTLNEFSVGMIDHTENHFVKFNGDTSEYTLVTPRETQNGSKKILLIKSLGYSFDEMMKTLKEMWPNRVVWKLDNPNDFFSR
jgi:hypothetical protein